MVGLTLRDRKSTRLNSSHLVTSYAVLCLNNKTTRSILLTKQIRGTPYLSACRQTVSDWGCPPATPSNTATAPSRTRSDRSFFFEWSGDPRELHSFPTRRSSD